MENELSFEAHIGRMITETKKELDYNESMTSQLKHRRTELADALRSYETTLNNYLKQTGKEPLVKTVADANPEKIDWGGVLKIIGPHRLNLIRIAEQMGGELKFGAAVNILYDNHYMKSKSRSNAYVQLYNVVKDMVKKGELEKIGQATYRLVKRPKQESLPNV
jgi:hypothetical protein